MSLEKFNTELKSHDLVGYWMIPNTSTKFRQPEADFEPYLWKWEALNNALHQATKFIAPEDAYRRFIGFQHPQINMGTAHTLLMGGQLIQPGEFAPAHRHTMEAVRFVVKGRGAMTVMEGEQFSMEEGDFITTPNWCWHDHINTGDTPIVWLDGSVGPMVQYFQIGFAELFNQRQQPVTRPVDWSKHSYGTLRPQGFESIKSTFRTPYRYLWEDTEKTLNVLAETPGDPFDGVLLRYADPITGGSTLPAMSCEIQLLRPGEMGRSHRHTHTVIYHVFRGTGVTTIEGKRFKWKKGDTFVLPLWKWHSHENGLGEPSILFSINDRPALKALRFYREEILD